ncbi:MAG: hypothetical protein Q7W05_14155 [Deltaproteobacteria bacterium]|nr:hypothetical protein [Deltaproteobacteria bacterium]
MNPNDIAGVRSVDGDLRQATTDGSGSDLNGTGNHPATRIDARPTDLVDAIDLRGPDDPSLMIRSDTHRWFRGFRCVVGDPEVRGNSDGIYH